MVRIHPDPPLQATGNRQQATGNRQDRGCSSAGRAPALQAGGRRFDPDQLHQIGWSGRGGCLAWDGQEIYRLQGQF